MSDVEKDIDDSRGKLIRSARQKLGITQAELARRMGVAYQHVWSWEHGRRGVSLESLLKASKAMEVDLMPRIK